MHNILRSIIHIILILAGFYLAYYMRNYTDLIPFVRLNIPTLSFLETMYFGIISAGIFVLLGVIRKLYTISMPIYQNYNRKFFDVMLIWVIVITFVAYFGNGFLFPHGISRFVIIIWAFISMILLLIFDGFYDELLYHMKIIRPAKVLFMITELNDNENAQSIENNLTTIGKYDIIRSYYNPDIDIKSIFTEQKPDIVMLVGDIDYNHLQYIADKTNINWAKFVHISQGLLLDDLDFYSTRIWPVIWLEYRTNTILEWNAVFKRVFDIVFSFFGLMLLSPILILTALVILIWDRWPIFYKHKRVGRAGKLFDYIKFRSMKLEYCTGEYFGNPKAEQYRQQLQDSDLNVRKWELQKIKDDPRITKIGKFIRKYSIDELPSLRCVLKGDMSIVGPRPHLLFEVDRYKSWMKRLLVCKPGITCYSQIFGRDRLPFEDEAKFDIYYIQNRSMWLDVYILFATLKVVFKWR